MEPPTKEEPFYSEDENDENLRAINRAYELEYKVKLTAAKAEEDSAFKGVEIASAKLQKVKKAIEDQGVTDSNQQRLKKAQEELKLAYAILTEAEASLREVKSKWLYRDYDDCDDYDDYDD